MNYYAQKSLQVLFFWITCLGVSFSSLQAEDVLFIGNSFTFGGGSKVISSNGGVPKLVGAIAASKGKTLETRMLAVGGKDFAFHLQQATTDTDLRLKKWDRVVLQGYSLEATHLRQPEEFLKNGELFYRRIRESSPNAKIVLYETWARGPGNKLYTGTTSPKTFADPAEMIREIQENYAKLRERLESLEPESQVELAPVGQAFSHCVKRYPEIDLFDAEKYHASTEGSYLAALVIYATIFQDQPLGATPEFFGSRLDADIARKLQEVAGEVTQPKKP